MKETRSFSLRSVLILSVLMIFFVSGSAYGAGFSLIEQGVSGLGNAYAGGSAIAEDATTIYFNPAGMTRLNGQEFIAAAHLIIPSAKFTNEGSTHVLQPVTGKALLGGNGGDGGVTKVVPNMYYSIKTNDRFAFGIAINSPFGLATKYDNGWVGRYHAIESDVLTININPAIAYKITDQLSVGGGVSVQYIKAKLSNAIDFGTLTYAGGGIPQMMDGFGELEGSSWGAGFNLGLLYEFTKNTRFGIHYRSRIQHRLSGDVTFSSVPAPLSPVFKNGRVTADLTLPALCSFSLAHSFSPEWTVMADFTWTGWSSFKELRVKYDNPLMPDSVTTENWKDSYRYSVGVSYKPTPAWTFRTGVAYDTSVISDDKYRTPRIPDSNRTWIALGMGYKISKMFSLDVGYAHLFVGGARTSQTATGENIYKGGLQGSWDSQVNIVGVQLNANF